MLRWKSKPCVLYLHADKVALYRQTEGQLDLIHECCFEPADLNGILGSNYGSCITTCIEHLPNQKTCLDVVLDDSYARFWLVTPPLHALYMSDLQVAAAIRFQTLFDLPAEEWRIEADWNAKRDFLACALPTATITQVQQLLKASNKQFVLTDCYPHFIQQWNRYAAQLGKQGLAFAVAGDGAITLAFIQEGAINAVRSLPLPTVDLLHLKTLEQSIHALSLQLGINVPREILLAGLVPLSFSEITTERICWRSASDKHQPPSLVQRTFGKRVHEAA